MHRRFLELKQLWQQLLYLQHHKFGQEDMGCTKARQMVDKILQDKGKLYHQKWCSEHDQGHSMLSALDLCTECLSISWLSLSCKCSDLDMVYKLKVQCYLHKSCKGKLSELLQCNKILLDSQYMKPS